MFENIKAKLWTLLKEKQVSLAMLYDKDGDILWHKGRRITGRHVKEAEGFPKSHVYRTLQSARIVDEDNIIVSSEEDSITRSAYVMQLKSLLIQPVSDRFFLYVDSGTKSAFSTTDREIFKIIGQLLGETIDHVKKRQQDIGGITGNSAEINRIRDLTLKYALEDGPVLLLGETGVGKSRLAGLIHTYSGRKGRFFTVNTPSIPENLFESEIFGFQKGSFTHATSDKKGYVDQAVGGTLFFDEIAEVPLAFQTKLLRFIETKTYIALGKTRETRADVRIVTATNRDLRKAMKQGLFREDLYYRLHVFELEIPPLRARRSDVRDLALEHYDLLRGKALGPGFWEALEQHDWPGNIRELVTVLTRAGVQLSSPISGEKLRLIMHGGDADEPRQPSGADSDLWRHLRDGADFWTAVWPLFIKRDLNKNQLRAFLQGGYAQNGQSLKRLSGALNIRDEEFKKFIAVLHKYDIHPARSRQT